MKFSYFVFYVLVNPKHPPHSCQWPTLPKDTISQHSFHFTRPSMTFHLTPTPPKEPKDEEKGYKPQKGAQNRPLGAKSLKKGLKLGRKELKAQKRG